MGYLKNLKLSRFGRIKPIKPREHRGITIDYKSHRSDPVVELSPNLTTVQRAIRMRGDLKTMRELSGLTPSEIVQRGKWKIAVTTYLAVESGKTLSPKFFTLKAIATGFNISLDDLNILLMNRRG